MVRIGMIALALLASTSMTALAAEIDVDAPIERVTVYPAGAAVTRSVPFTVPAGVSTLIVGDLPSDVDTTTLRITGAGDAGLTIVGVTTSLAKIDTDEDPDRIRLDDSIQSVRDQLAAIEDELAVLRAQRTFLDNLITEAPGGLADLLGNQGTGIEQWTQALGAIGQGLDEVIAGVRDAGNRQRALNTELVELQAELALLPQPRGVTEVAIEVDAVADASGAFTVTYQVANAGWAPTYEAQLDTGSSGEEPSIELIRRAQITQSTGEDWTDVALTLSTTRPAGGTEAPYLSPSAVAIEAYFRDQFGYGGAPSSVAAAEAAPAPIMDGRMINQVQAIADFGDFKADFIVPNPVTVESAGGVRSVRLATDTSNVELFVDAVPRLSEQAFLTASFVVASEAPVLSGPVTLFRDGSFVGNGQVDFANPGEEVEIGFGVDDQVRVTWTVVSRDVGQAGFLTRVNTEEIHYAITVDNGHSRAIDIRVLDRIPYTEDSSITVTRLPETTAPTEEDVDGRRGVLAWTYGYEPGESREIEIAYIVTWPGDQSVMGLE